jgi:transcriptional regulator with XRE-family HTH domain
MKSQPSFKPALFQIGQRIYHHRVIKNITTKEIASKLSLSPEAYRNIEKGNCDFSITTFLMVTSLLKMDVWELMESVEQVSKF